MGVAAGRQSPLLTLKTRAARRPLCRGFKRSDPACDGSIRVSRDFNLDTTLLWLDRLACEHCYGAMLFSPPAHVLVAIAPLVRLVHPCAISWDTFPPETTVAPALEH